MAHFQIHQGAADVLSRHFVAVILWIAFANGDQGLEFTHANNSGYVRIVTSSQVQRQEDAWRAKRLFGTEPQ